MYSDYSEESFYEKPCKGSSDKKCKTNCCKGMVVDKYTMPESKGIYAYIERIFDEKHGEGSVMFKDIDIDLTDSNYIVTTKITPKSAKCCECNLSNCSIFTIDCVKASVALVAIANPSASQVLINGTPTPDDPEESNGVYKVIIPTDATVINHKCKADDLGTKANLLLNNIGPFTTYSVYELWGTVNTEGHICDFYVKIEDSLTGPGELFTDSSSNLMVTNLCIPYSKVYYVPYILLNFNGDIELMNPELTIIQDTECGLNLQGRLMLTPKVLAEVIKPTKGTMHATILECK